MKRLIEIHVAHGAEISELRDIFFEVLDEVDQDDLGARDEHEVRVTGQDVFGQIVTFCLTCANPNNSWGLSCDVRERLIKRMQDLEHSGSKVFQTVNPAEGA